MVMVKPALAYLDVIADAARPRRCAGRGLSRQRRVRDDPAPRPNGAGSTATPWRSSTSAPSSGPEPTSILTLLHPLVRRRRARRAAFRSNDGLAMTIAFCDPDRCPAAGCTADGVHGRRRALEPHDVRAVDAGHPRRRELLDPGLQGGRRRAVRRGAGGGRHHHRRRGHDLLRPGAELRRDHPRSRPPRGHRRPALPRPATARRTARRRHGR